MNRIKLIVTLTGCITGFAFVAFASSGACNKSTSVDCKALDAVCTAKSPNCSGSYNGKVSQAGSKTAITSGSPGYDNWTDDTKCSYVCKITSDCDGLSPEVNMNGGYNQKVASGAHGC